MMSPGRYIEHLNRGGLTVHDIFEEFTPTTVSGGSPRPVDEFAVLTPLEYAEGSRSLFIAPSRLELAWSLRDPARKETLLARFVSKVASDFDLIIIDCSPTDSILTDAAYHCSRYVLVPIRAEFLATIGFPLLNKSLNAFKMRHEEKVIEVCGLVFNDHDRLSRKREHKTCEARCPG